MLSYLAVVVLAASGGRPNEEGGSIEVIEYD